MGVSVVQSNSGASGAGHGAKRGCGSFQTRMKECGSGEQWKKVEYTEIRYSTTVCIPMSNYCNCLYLI